MLINVLMPSGCRSSDAIIREQVTQAATSDIDIRLHYLDSSVEHVISDYTAAYIAQDLVLLAESLDLQGDAIVLNCFMSGYGVTACKEKLAHPSVCTLDAALTMAGVMGDHPGMLLPDDKMLPAMSRRLVKRELPLATCAPDDTTHLEKAVKQLLAQGCDVIILGYDAPPIWYAAQLREKFGAEFIWPLPAAIAACAFMVRNQLRYSAIAYPEPPEKELRLGTKEDSLCE